MNQRNQSTDPRDSDEPIEGTAEKLLEVSNFFNSSKEAVEKHTRCPICNGNLHFSHLTDFSKNLTQECAQCPECGIRIRQNMHRLQ